MAEETVVVEVNPSLEEIVIVENEEAQIVVVEAADPTIIEEEVFVVDASSSEEIFVVEGDESETVVTEITEAPTVVLIGGAIGADGPNTVSTLTATDITGILKGNGSTVLAATAGVDYLTPTGSAAQLTNFPTLNQNTTGTAAGLTTQYIDWSASTGGNSIANKPTLGTASAQDVGYFALSGHNHSGVYEPVDATILRQADVDDTPVDGVTTAPISSNWAYDHVAAADPHTGYMLESNIGTGANNYIQLNGSSQLPAVSAALLTNFPTLNQDTTGSAVYWKTSGTGKASITGPTTGNTRTYTFPDSDATILYSGGALGTPSSGTLTNCTFPTLNQNTTGTAAGLTAQYIDWDASSGGASIANKPTIPVKASGTEIIVGTDDAKFATAKAIKDAGLTLRLKQKTVLSSDATTVTFTGLDSAVDGMYTISCEIPGSGYTGHINCYINGDTTDANYIQQYHEAWSGNNTAQNINNNPTTGYLENYEALSRFTLVVLNGHAWFRGHQVRRKDTNYNMCVTEFAIIYKTAISSITSLRFSSGTNAFKTGSIFRIYSEY